jgi:exopolysaccharide production protein ExoY
MSMVGPRPVVEQELDEYRTRGALDVYVRARPGLTGVWQVNAHRCPSYDARVALDASYTARSSVRTDFRVIVETVALVVRDVWGAARRRSSPPSAD